MLSTSLFFASCSVSLFLLLNLAPILPLPLSLPFSPALFPFVSSLRGTSQVLIALGLVHVGVAAYFVAAPKGENDPQSVPNTHTIRI